MKRFQEWVIEKLLLIAAVSSLFVTFLIFFLLIRESIPFFQEVSVVEFFTGTQWTPLFSTKKFGILPLLTGTLLTTLIASLVALPSGYVLALFLSEFASSRVRSIVKPLLELLTAVPSIVYGYFALLFVTPLLQWLIPNLAGFNALSPGIVMGIMIIPMVSSLSEDAMRAVPMALRESAYALGSSRFRTAWTVVTPAAFSGIVASFILALSRAIGETMIVTIAAGLQPNFTLNPLVPIQTLTAYIVQVSQGDVPYASIEYQTIFVVGLFLFCITLVFNMISYWLKMRYREIYG
jgi:phosphate transport system permease protein